MNPSPSLHRRKERDLIAFLQNIVRALIIQADRRQSGFLHGSQFREASVEFVQQCLQSAAVGQDFLGAGAAGEVLEIRVETNGHAHLNAEGNGWIADMPIAGIATGRKASLINTVASAR